MGLCRGGGRGRVPRHGGLMRSGPPRWLERRLNARALARWQTRASEVEALGAGRRRALRDEAQGLRAVLDRFLARTDRRAMQARSGLALPPLPAGSDWHWRPECLTTPLLPRGLAAPDNGARLCPGTALWHDCPARGLVLEQVPATERTGLTPFALRLEVFGFSGSYLSLALDLPQGMLQGLGRSHVVRLETAGQAEAPIRVYARLNIGNGPNVDEMTLKLADFPAGRHSTQVTEFDLAYTGINERRLEKAWLDLIFEAPRMNGIVLEEILLSRHLRAGV